jgi:hypothetical protein
MEREDRDTEIALREQITTLREQLARVYREAGHLEAEVRRREGEYIAIRSSRWVDDLE